MVRWVAGILVVLVNAWPLEALALERLLYVANDKGRIDIFDIEDGHRKVRSIKMPISRARGITAHPGTARLYFSDSDKNHVVAVDLLTHDIVWKRKYQACDHVDRLNVTGDGKALYVPCKHSAVHLVVDAATGDPIKTFALENRPHNTFAGEGGTRMYLSAYRNGTMLVADITNHSIVGEIGTFSSGVRPFAVNPEETHVFCNLTGILGFGVGDIRTGEVIHEVVQVTPPERTAHPAADAGLTHGDQPKSHGLAFRPGAPEVWFLDDAWGYLYAYDVTKIPPRHLASVPLFTDIEEPWTTTRWRWLAFSIDGRYAYPGSGAVVDAQARRLIGDRITPSEKLIEIQFENGVPVRAGGQNGGVYSR
jgi:hypothetical protein